MVDRFSHTAATMPAPPSRSKTPAANEPKTTQKAIRDRPVARRMLGDLAPSGAGVVAVEPVKRGTRGVVVTSLAGISGCLSCVGVGVWKHSPHLGQRTRAFAGMASGKRKRDWHEGQEHRVADMIHSPPGPSEGTFMLEHIERPLGGSASLSLFSAASQAFARWIIAGMEVTLRPLNAKHDRNSCRKVFFGNISLASASYS